MTTMHIPHYCKVAHITSINTESTSSLISSNFQSTAQVATPSSSGFALVNSTNILLVQLPQSSPVSPAPHRHATTIMLHYLVSAQNTNSFDVLKLFDNVEKLSIKNFKILRLRVTMMLMTIQLQKHLTTKIDSNDADEKM